MRPATDTLADMLDAWSPLDVIRKANLYIITLANGGIIRYSGFQTSVQAPAPTTDTPLYTFYLGPAFSYPKSKVQVGTKVSELTLDVLAGPNDLLGVGGTISWQSALQQGIFDGATLKIWRAFLRGQDTQFPTVVGTITWFFGRIGEVEIGRSKITLKVKSMLDLLQPQGPARLLQASCGWVFGGDGCFFNRLTLAANLTCIAGSSQAALYFTETPVPVTLYNLGSVTCLSGLNAGFGRSIANTSWAAGTLGVFYFRPWVFPVVAGVDKFQLLPGCDHTLGTCTNVFNNAKHYGGFPYIPPPETAI